MLNLFNLFSNNNSNVFWVSLRITGDSVRVNVTWETFAQFVQLLRYRGFRVLRLLLATKPSVSVKVREFFEILFT